MKYYFRISELDSEVSRAILNRAYKVLARKARPDHVPPEQRDWANLRMQEINEAHDVLTDPGRRATYERYRRTEFWRVFWREGLSGLSRRWAGRS